MCSTGGVSWEDWWDKLDLITWDPDLWARKTTSYNESYSLNTELMDVVRERRVVTAV